MAKISDIKTEITKDSRGDETIRVTMSTDSLVVVQASVPQGKSTGVHEAVSVPATDAAQNIAEKILPAVRGMDVQDTEAIDRAMIDLDGTPDKSNLGANAMLAVSIAILRAVAVEEGVPLWQKICEVTHAEAPAGYGGVVPYINIVNGGAHAENNLVFQEYMVLPKGETMDERLARGEKIYHALGEHLKHSGMEYEIGDEGGYSLDFESDIAPFEIIEEVAARASMRGQFALGMDAAATGIKRTSNELFETYTLMHKRFAGAFAYLEDPFGEEDFESFAGLKKEIGDATTIAGDDLTTTNVLRMQKAVEAGSINGVIVKPNQIGTVTETLEAVRFARERGWKVVVSHRSGETEDSFIADLAWGVFADGIKIGAPEQKERRAKYERLRVIENEEHAQT